MGGIGSKSEVDAFFSFFRNLKNFMSAFCHPRPLLHVRKCCHHYGVKKMQTDVGVKVLLVVLVLGILAYDLMALAQALN